VNDATDKVPACPNCGAPAGERYCATCGQETRLALPTAREFLREAAGRYVALDGKLWRSLALLLARPGFLTREYFAGRRLRYVRPARLFLVLSIATFAVLRVASDSSVMFQDDRETSAHAPRGDAATSPPSSRRHDEDIEIGIDELESLSPELGKRLHRFRGLSRQEKADQLYAGALRYGPYAMFALLPAFALLLRIAYAGRRRRYPNRPRRYAEHLVFAAHNHAFLFLVVIIAAALPFGIVRAALWLWSLAYFAWSMRAVYGGRWSGVLARGALVALAYTILFGFAIAGLIVAAALLG
jgi:hypothetical protein